MEHKLLQDAPSNKLIPEARVDTVNPSVPQKQEAGYSPGTDSLPCSSALVLPPTPHIASLITATEPSVICFLFPRSQLQLRSLSHILNSACSKMSDLRYLSILLPVPNPPSRHLTLVCRMPMKCFPSEPGFPASRAKGTLKS